MSEDAVGPRPVLMVYVEDVARSRDFYRDVVGLDLDFDAGSYAQFTWGHLVLGLRARDNARRQYGDAVEPARSGASHQVTVEVDDVDAMAARLAARGAEIVEPPTDQSWGMRSATLRDPDGHLWEICRPLG